MQEGRHSWVKGRVGTFEDGCMAQSDVRRLFPTTPQLEQAQREYDEALRDLRAARQALHQGGPDVEARLLIDAAQDRVAKIAARLASLEHPY